ncbi:Ubiquitin domain [Phytophthora cinnamomi]|uniref:Ubiquitin domain n=1 Tax=Phytophthora cinnamomi TaxID=4785 RepID=UPI003559AD22|nr:Ubiquitin domain [Phytophthora cinnamomi]
MASPAASSTAAAASGAETIKLTIKSETSAFSLEAAPSESVAGVKAAYQEGATSDAPNNFILLLHKGKELPDEKTLAQLGITDGDVLVHIEAAHQPFHPLNYKLLAESIKTRRKHEDSNLQMLKEDNIWAAGADGTVHRLGMEKSIISRSLNGSLPPHFAPKKVGAGRAFFNQLSVRVNGCSYHVLPSMEGRWNGELTTVPEQEEGSQVCSNDLVFRDDEGVWSQRQSRTTMSGLTSMQHMWIKPVSDGILKIETDDPTLRGSDITMQELGTNVIIITATSKRSGRPLMVETITGIDSSRRLRTIQRFDESGAFRSVYVMNEVRVVDAVSGAMEKYDNVF